MFVDLVSSELQVRRRMPVLEPNERFEGAVNYSGGGTSNLAPGGTRTGTAQWTGWFTRSAGLAVLMPLFFVT